MKSRFFSTLAVALILLANISSCAKKGELGSVDNPVKLYFTPSVDGDVIAKNSETFIKFLEKETGLFFKSGIPTNYIAVVEAFGSDRADIAVMNSFGYLLSNTKYGAEAKLKVLRHGSDHYYGQIITHVDNNINTLEDLKGKSFAFTDPSSTSGYMFPLKMLKDKNVSLGNTVFAVKHDNVVTMVYQKQVNAGATFHSPASSDGKIKDARERVLTQFPDVEKKVKIIAVTEAIPNDPFVFRKGLPKEITDKFIAAVKKFIETPEGKEVFEKIYSVNGVVDASDTDYNVLREMVAKVGVNAEEVLKTAK
ncbi:MAG: phosphate/phosphite/phosphonate ABC transporter substrate-binding protein [Bacteriovoracaceae bacterium]